MQLRRHVAKSGPVQTSLDWQTSCQPAVSRGARYRADVAAIDEDEINGWIDAIAVLYGTAVRDEDARVTAEAVANLWSGFGYQDPPPQVQQMLIQAIEIGYATAMHDVRDGQFDGEIKMWRPNITDH
jgi:hypothetical protein